MNESLKKKLANYRTPTKAVDVVSETKMVFLVGIAGAGKNTVLAEILKDPGYQFIVSHTTRPPRENKGVPEIDGKDYHFIDYQQAEQMLDGRQFVEAKNVHGRLYGTSIEEVESIKDTNKAAITDIDIQGVEEYHSISPDIVAVFLLPPDFASWQKRLQARYGESGIDPQELRERMRSAKFELQKALDDNFFEFVINDELERTVQAVKDITAGKTSEAKNRQAKKMAEELLSKL